MGRPFRCAQVQRRAALQQEFQERDEEHFGALPGEEGPRAKEHASRRFVTAPRRSEDRFRAAQRPGALPIPHSSEGDLVAISTGVS
jgi:hypothetical protein